jgi:hypothetical protein
MRTAPELGRRAEEKSDVRDNVLSSKPPRSPQQKSHPLVKELQRRRARLRRLLPKLDALCVWKRDIERRIADVDARLWEPNEFFSRVYQDEVDDLADAVAAWRLAAARVVLDLGPEADMRRADA